MTKLGSGKIPPELLGALLGQYTGRIDPALRLGPRLGTDAAVIQVDSSQFLVLAADPITFTTHRVGWYAVHVNANDVAVCGARPRWFLCTLLLPEGTEVSMVEEIFRELHTTCEALGISLVGGHTEVTAAVSQPTIAGTMAGVTRHPIAADGARPGDVLLCTKGVAIEGTSILAVEFAPNLRQQIDMETLQRARSLATEPGISIVQEALAAAEAGASALHDVTEGGILTAAWELATASRCGVQVDLDAIPVLPETEQIARALRADPYRLLGSGCLLIACPPDRVHAIENAIREVGSTSTPIGRFLESGMLVKTTTGVEELTPCEDELARLLANAGHQDDVA